MRIPTIEQPGLLTRVFFKIGERMFGQVPTPERLMAYRLPLMLGIGGLYGAIEWFGKVDAELRALLNVQVAALYGVPYWMDIRHAVGVKAGVPAVKLAEVLRYRESPHFSERECAAFEFCERIIRDDLEVSDACFTRLQKHFTAAEILELTFIIGYQTFASKFAKAFGLVPQDFSSEEKTLWRSWLSVPRVPGLAFTWTVSVSMDALNRSITNKNCSFAWGKRLCASDRSCYARGQIRPESSEELIERAERIAAYRRPPRPQLEIWHRSLDTPAGAHCHRRPAKVKSGHAWS